MGSPDEDLISRYQSLVKHSADVITLAAADGTIEYQSPSVERVLGYDQESLVGESVFDYVHPDDLDRIESAIQVAIEAPPGGVHEVEYRFRHADGSWVWLASVATDRGAEGTQGFVVNSRGVTERVAYEDQLEAVNLELEALNRVMRHDVRNDMAVILGWAELLEDHVDEEGLSYLEKILASGEHVVELTEVARDFVEALTTDASPSLEPVSLRSVLETELAVRREFHPDASIEVDGELPAVQVTANEMLASVFTNLLNNAVQHNPYPDPSVVVSATVGDDTVEVRIADDGPGIPEDLKTHLFGKGEKGLDSSGTGIGLYLVRTIVEQYGGAVTVEDNEPTGAVFVVRLPLAD